MRVTPELRGTAVSASATGIQVPTVIVWLSSFPISLQSTCSKHLHWSLPVQNIRCHVNSLLYDLLLLIEDVSVRWERARKSTVLRV